MNKRTKILYALALSLIIVAFLLAGLLYKEQREDIDRLYSQSILLSESAKQWESAYNDLCQTYLTTKNVADYWEGEYNSAQSRYLDLLAYPIIKEVEKVVYHNIYPRQWESIEQFTEWYNSQDFRILMSSGCKVDCNDYADWVQTKALEQGYSVSIALVWYGYYYNGQQVTDKYASEVPGHTGCMVNIKGIYYYFEPYIRDFNGLVEIVGRD